MIELAIAALIWNADLVDEVQTALQAPVVVTGDQNTAPYYEFQPAKDIYGCSFQCSVNPQ